MAASAASWSRKTFLRTLPEAVRGNARVQEAYLGSVLADQQAAGVGH